MNRAGAAGAGPPRHSAIACWTAGWVVAAVLAAGPALAAVHVAAEESYELPAGERLEQELWLKAGEATLAGDAADDISLFAGSITLSGTLGGDVHALATRQLTFSGTAAEQLRLAGLRIQFDGHARKSVIAAANSISLSDAARLDDAAILVADTVVTGGEQQGPLWVVANKATIQGVINGDLRIIADDIVIQPGTVIRGDVVYSSTRELTPGSRVLIDGEVRRHVVAGPGLSYAGYLRLLLSLFVSTLLLGLPLIRFLPRTLGLSAGLARTAPGRCALAGLAALWLLPLLAVACLFSPVTLPLGLVLLGTLALLGFLAQVVAALVLGSLLHRRPTPPSYARVGLSFAAGLLLLYILAATPIINLMVWIAAITLGTGGLVMGVLASQQKIARPHAANADTEPPDPPPPLPPADGPHDVSQPKE